MSMERTGETSIPLPFSPEWRLPRTPNALDRAARRPYDAAEMPAEAKVSRIWKQQKLFMAIFVLCFSAWFAYDGFYGYPAENKRFDAHAQYEKEGRLSEWPAYAKSQGWKAEAPHKRHKDGDIVVQFVFAGIIGVAGIFFLLYWATRRGRILRTDEEAVYTPSGKRVPFSAVTGIGKKNWESKGIAKVRYEIEGQKGEFEVDDYMFDTEPSRQILTEIESRLLARFPSAGEAEPTAISKE